MRAVRKAYSAHPLILLTQAEASRMWRSSPKIDRRDGCRGKFHAVLGKKVKDDKLVRNLQNQ